MENEQKAMPQIWYELYDRMISQIEDLGSESDLSISQVKQAYTVCRGTVDQLRSYIVSYAFRDKTEEIHFFKVIKPKFLSLLIFYNKRLGIELRKPIGSRATKEHYYRKELFKLKIFFENYIEFYHYYRSGADFLDTEYFLRSTHSKKNIVHPPYLDEDGIFSTGYDLLVSKVMANEKLADYLNSQLEIMYTKNKGQIHYSNTNTKELTWTASKVAIAELIYALYAFSSFNNTHVEIKTISDYFSRVFNVKIGNVYKMFEEIRLRKKNRTAFLDELKLSLIRKMDQDDENSL